MSSPALCPGIEHPCFVSSRGPVGCDTSLVAWSSKMLGGRAGGSQAKGSGAANFLSGMGRNRGRNPRVARGAGPRGKVSCANWSRRFRWKKKPGRIDSISRTTGTDSSWRAACFVNCSAGIFGKLRRAWSFPMGNTESLLSRERMLRADFVSICRTRQAWPCTRLPENEILGLTWSTSGRNSAGDDIAERYFSAREVSDLRTLPPEARVDGFFHCWTRKEAYLKATGMGLQIPLDSFSVSLLPEKPAQFLGGVEPRWHMAAFHPAEGYVAAVVYDGAPCSIKYFSVDPQLK